MRRARASYFLSGDEESTAAALAACLKPHALWLSGRGSGLYDSTDMRGPVADLDAIAHVLTDLVMLDPRGGLCGSKFCRPHHSFTPMATPETTTTTSTTSEWCGDKFCFRRLFGQPAITQGLTLCLAGAGLTSVYHSHSDEALSHADQLNIGAYKLRVALAHLRNKFDNGVEVASLADAFEVMKHGGKEESQASIAKRSRRETRLRDRPHPFVFFAPRRISPNLQRIVRWTTSGKRLYLWPIGWTTRAFKPSV